VRRPKLAWNLYSQAREWRTRPSQLIGLVEGSYPAYCFDEAIYIWGNFVSSELDKVKAGKTEEATRVARVRRLNSLLLDEDETLAQVKGLFSDPGAKLTTKD
jgi:hypothetical protein